MNRVKLGKAVILAALAFVAGIALPKAYSAADMTYQQLQVLVDVLNLVRENYVDEVEPQKLVYGAAHGIVQKLDDFSQFMEPDTNSRVKSDTDGQFGGLGITIGQRDGYILVVSPMPGTPAYGAGILPNDKIIKVDDESTKDMDPDEAVKRMRGTPGTKVRITIAREGAKDKDGNTPVTTQEMTLTREIIKKEVIQTRLLENKVGYIHMLEFTGHTTADFVAALADLKKQGMESLVLDLRNNPGGLLTSAVETCRMFLGDNKMIVFTKGRRPENYQEFRANSKAQYGDLPLVVLINGGSASGSEIVAGAMQDNKRAVLVGARSFGKASVQSIIPLSDGSGLRLTVARYYTPLGRSIHRDKKANTGGITPDVEIPVTIETEVKLMMQSSMIYTPGKEAKSSVKKEDMVKDEVLNRAVELLKARDAFASLSVK